MGPEQLPAWKVSALASDLNETRGGASDDSVFQIIPRSVIHKDGRSDPTNSSSISVTQGASVSFESTSQIGIAIGPELLIFDSTLEKLEQIIPFSSAIDLILWNKSLLLVGLCSSELFFLNPTTFEQLDTRIADPSQVEDLKKRKDFQFFLGGRIQVDNNICEVLMVNFKGSIFRFPTSVAPDQTLDYTQSEITSCINMTMACMKTTMEGHRLLSSCHFLSSEFLYVAEKLGIITLLELTNSPSLECTFVETSNLMKDVSMDAAQVFIKKISRCDGFLFVLLSTGRLEILFDDMLISTGSLELPIPGTSVHDFSVTLKVSATEGDMNIWAIFGNFKCPSSTYIGVFSGLGFKPKLCIQLPAITSLTPDGLGSPCWPKVYEDDAVSCEFSFRFNQQNHLSEEPSSFECLTQNGIFLFQMLESSSESTLMRFLSQENFKKATAFAEKYSLDLDIVRKARVQAYYKEIAGLEGDAQLRVFDKIVELLETISDTDFICGFCLCDKRTIFPKLSWVKKILGLGCKKAIAVAATEVARDLLLLNKKFYTFEQIFSEGEVEGWKEFSDTDRTSMYELCKRFLKNEQFRYCNCIWTRHSAEFIESLDLGDLAHFFWGLFCKQLSTPETVNFFQTILPDALDKCVEEGFDMDKGLDGIMDLVKKQICFLERSLRWPKEACDFVQVLIRVLHEEIDKLQEALLGARPESTLDDKIVVCQKLIGRLELFAQCLREITQLIQNHSMRIPFNKYIQDDALEVVHAMLDELLTKQEILIFYKKFLVPYALRQDLSLDYVFESYIESIVNYVQVYANSPCIPFEERLVTLVELIEKLKTRLTSIHLMATNWPVPWSKGVDKLVSEIVLDLTIGPKVECRDDCRRLQQEIANVQKNVPFQCLLLKYRLFASKVVTPMGVDMAILRILNSQKPSAYEDCRELVKFTGIRGPDDIEVTKAWLLLGQDDFEGDVEDVLAKDLPTSAIVKMKDYFVFVISHESSGSRSPAVLERFTRAAEILSKRLDSHKDIEFLCLRKLVPDLSNLSPLFDPAYPFNVVETKLLHLSKLPSNDIFEYSKKLAAISFYSYHEIVLAVMFFMMEKCPPSAAFTAKVWEVLAHVVKIPCPIRAPMLEDLTLFGITELICQNPSWTVEQQMLLEKFLNKVVKSFDKSFTELSKYVNIHAIFMTLRDHELPFENNFLLVVNALLSGKPQTIPQFVDLLKDISRGLIKYGENNLMIRILNLVILHHRAVRDQFDELNVKKYCNSMDIHIVTAKKDLLTEAENYKESEPNPHVLKLVTALCAAGVYCNAFSLRSRNKAKLIDTLLIMKEFGLAANVGLLFKYYNKVQWSQILQGYIEMGNTKLLKTLLQRDLKNITELWVLPEFTRAWLRVTEVEPEFKQLCPIPLS